MELLATSHQKINKNFLTAIGLWPHQTGFMKWLLLFNMLFFTLSQAYFQIGGMIAAWEDKDVFMESIPPVFMDFVVASKVINFIGNSQKMKDLLHTLEEDWRIFKGRKELAILNEYAILGRKLTLSYAGCLLGGMTPFMALPAVPILLDLFDRRNETRERILMFRVDFLVDAEKYYYPLLIHSYITTLMYITTIVAIDTMFMTYVQHACGSFAILGYQLKHLTDGVDIDLDVYPQMDDDIIYHDMAECVTQHNHALEYSRLVEDANNISYFFQLGMIMISISFTGFQAVMNMETPEIAIRYGAFTLSQTLLLFLQSYPGQMLYDHSVQVSENVHNCGWYKTSIRTRKLVCLMTMRSRVPCELTAGRFYALNLANFSAVVRTSMSYLTVLTSVQ